MKTRNAMKKAWQIYRSAPGTMLSYAVIAAILMVLPLVPMLCIVDPAVRMVSVLSVPLMLLVSVPMRRMAAKMLCHAVHGDGV